MRGVVVRAAFLVGLAACCQADVAVASAFTVNPTQIVLSSRTRAALLTVRNDSAEPLRFQITVFTWAQAADGQMRLMPTEDIVVFPTLFTIAPREERKMRVGVATAFAPTEKAYRIFVEELPAPEAATAEGTAVNVLTRMGVPIFLRPPNPTASARISGLALQDGRIVFELHSTGTIHVIPQQARLTATDAAGHAVVSRDLEAWYILAGGLRRFEIDIPRPLCEVVRRVSVDVKFDSGALSAPLQTPSGVCR